MLTLASFVLAIGLLVAVHEWGHFAMARLFGVRVLTFSVGMGPRVAGWTSKQTGTEFVIGLLPIGGYVRMLDEREAPVAQADKPYAFNRKPLRQRAAIVAAGPLVNLAFAVFLYACVNWGGVSQAVPLVSTPPAGSLAAQAGFRGGETVQQVGFLDEEKEPVVSYEDFRWWLTRAALAKRDLDVTYTQAGSQSQREARLEFSTFSSPQSGASMFRAIGFTGPQVLPYLGDISPDGAAFAAGLRTGDRVIRVDGILISDAGALRDLIRASAALGLPKPQIWEIERGDQRLRLDVRPMRVQEGEGFIGRVGAVIGSPPAQVVVRHGFVGGLTKAVTTTWDVSALTVRTMFQMLTGEASIKNLSGPITIADYAGKSATLGVAAFMTFLALISVSLGVLNLLPLPMLDGGHLMYYLWEAFTGRPVSDLWTERLQRVGLAMLMLLMTVAVFNDVTRLLA